MQQKVSKFRVAIYGLLVDQGRVLMTETAVPSGSVINFPGGGLELGEDPANALLREFQEETQTSVQLGELLYTSKLFHQNKDFPNEQVFHVYYRVHGQGAKPIGGGNQQDVLNLHWFSIDEIPLPRVGPPDLEFIKSSIFTNLFG